MTGGGSKQKRIDPIPPDPSPTPILAEEVAGAKRKVRGRKRGRGENILAGRMMAGRRDILKTKFGE